MCLGEMRPEFEPNTKLKKMVVLVKIVAAINLVIALLRIFIGDFRGLLYDLLAVMMLMFGCMSFKHNYLSLYMFITLIQLFIHFISLGIAMQQLILGDNMIKTTRDYITLGMLIFFFVFYIFALISVFPVYKETKAQLKEHLTGANLEGGRGDLERHIVQRGPVPSGGGDSNAEQSFRPFAGRGVAVGSN